MYLLTYVLTCAATLRVHHHQSFQSTTTLQCQRQFIQRASLSETKLDADARFVHRRSIWYIVSDSTAGHLRSHVPRNTKNLDKAFISLSDVHLPRPETNGRWRSTHKLFAYNALLRCLVRCAVFQRVVDAVSYECRTPFRIQSHLHDTVFGNGVQLNVIKSPDVSRVCL